MHTLSRELAASDSHPYFLFIWLLQVRNLKVAWWIFLVRCQVRLSSRRWPVLPSEVWVGTETQLLCWPLLLAAGCWQHAHFLRLGLSECLSDTGAGVPRGKNQGRTRQKKRLLYSLALERCMLSISALFHLLHKEGLQQVWIIHGHGGGWLQRPPHFWRAGLPQQRLSLPVGSERRIKSLSRAHPQEEEWKRAELSGPGFSSELND